MKKVLALLLALCALLSLAACAGKSGSTEGGKLQLEKEGVAAYNYSGSEKAFLTALGLADRLSVVGYCAPANARSMELTRQVLQPDGTWSIERIFAASREEGDETVLQGLISVLRGADNSFTYGWENGDSGNWACSFTEMPEMDFAVKTRQRVFMPKSHYFEMDKELPLAVTVFDDEEGLAAMDPIDYYTPELFEGMNYVEVICLRFRETPLEGATVRMDGTLAPEAGLDAAVDSNAGKPTEVPAA